MSGNRVAFYLPDLSGGGAERVMITLGSDLSQRGAAVDLVVATARGEYVQEVPDSVRLVDLRSPGVTASLPRLIAYLRRERPEAMVATLRHASVVALWAKRLSGVPTRTYIREASTPSAIRPKLTNIKGRLLPFFARHAYSWATGFIAVSSGVAADLERSVGVSRERIRTIYNPVVTPDLAAKASEPLDHPWFAPGQPPVVLSVGRLAPVKGFDTLLRAFARVRQEREVRLVILGEGEERERLERLAAELGVDRDLQLPGFVANPFPYMSRAALYVLASKREGLPGAMIQALACGCPVVSTDCPSGPREVLEDGRLGALVPVGDEQAMAAAIARTLDEPPERDRLRRRGNEFDQASSADAYLALLLPHLARARQVA